MVIRFRSPRGIDFPYLVSMIHGSLMSRANSIVIPGNKLDLAMQLILTPLILQLVEPQSAPEGSVNMTRHETLPPPADERVMANALRVLAMDAVEAAQSGHPGMPMGMADVATVLFNRFMTIDPQAPDWPDRDRFVLSAGHGSMLLYGINHLLGYADMPAEAAPAPSASSARRRPVIPSTATRSASRRRPARSARVSPPPSAWRSPSGCSTPASARSRRSLHLGHRRRRLPDGRASATRRSTSPATSASAG